MPPAGTTANRRPQWAKDDERRRADYAEAEEFAEGVQWLGKARRGERRLTFNYARTLLRKVVAYAIPSPIGFTSPVAGDVGKEHAAAAEEQLAAALDALDADELDRSLLELSSTIGDAACKVTWDVDAAAPAITAVHPADLTVRYDPGNPANVFMVRHDYSLPGYAIAPTFGRGVEASALNPEQLYPVREEWTAAAWSLWVNQQPVVPAERNPYGWIPYVFLPNERHALSFWGRSDLPDLYDVCRQLNTRLSILDKILELSGAPIAVLENVDGADGITVGPGATWELPEGAKAYLLDLLGGGGGALHIQGIDGLYRVLHDLSETPRTAFGDTGRALSGAALEVEIQPLVQRVRRKRRGLARFYAARNRRLLDLLAMFGEDGAAIGPARRTVPTWPSVLPSDEDAQTRNLVALVGAQMVSRHTAGDRLGVLDPEAELGRIVGELALLAGGAPVVTSAKGEKEQGGDDEDREGLDEEEGEDDDDAGE